MQHESMVYVIDIIASLVEDFFLSYHMGQRQNSHHIRTQGPRLRETSLSYVAFFTSRA